MQDLEKNWIVNVLYDLANAALNSKQFELSKDIATVAATHDASRDRLHDHSKFMVRFLDELQDLKK